MYLLGSAPIIGLKARIPAVAVLAGVAMATAVIIVSTVRYPGIFRLPGASIDLTLTVVMLLAYTGCGVWALRHPASGYRTGLIWGAAAGAMWSAEIWSGGPARLGYPAEQALGATFELLAVAATITAGVRTGIQARRAVTSWQAGLFSGLVSGVIVYVFAVIMTLSTLPILASRSDYQAQFAHSHAPSMTIFLVGDILGAVAAHLVINLILGLIGGGIGALISREPQPASSAKPA